MGLIGISLKPSFKISNIANFLIVGKSIFGIDCLASFFLYILKFILLFPNANISVVEVLTYSKRLFIE